MKSLSVLSAVAAVLACGVAAQAQQTVEVPVFFKDVPGPPARQAADAAATDDRLHIYHGDVATRKQFPFQAALYIDLNVFCGGSLINEKWVLTAAHCVEGGTIWYVMLGLTESMTPVQEGRSTHVTRGGVRHPDYNSRQIINDIGLIQLMRPASFSAYVKTIALTPPRKKYEGVLATVSGFGRTDDVNASPISPVLRYTKLPVVPNKVCGDVYGSSTLDPSVICLRAETSSSCQGDSGGPLTVTDSMGKLIQIGTVSFGSSRGCTAGYPVGYGNLAIFIDWISHTTGVNFNNPSA